MAKPSSAVSGKPAPSTGAAPVRGNAAGCCCAGAAAGAGDSPALTPAVPAETCPVDVPPPAGLVPVGDGVAVFPGCVAVGLGEGDGDGLGDGEGEGEGEGDGDGEGDGEGEGDGLGDG